MPIIFSLVLMIAVFYCFWIFVRTATLHQTGRFLAFLAIAVFIIALVYLAVSGRLPWALGAIIAVWPLMAAYFDLWRQKKLLQNQQPKRRNKE